MDPPGGVYEFGEYRLDAPARRLWRGNQHVTLGQKAVDALVRLLERQGELVEKEELIGLLWPDIIVHENNLNQQISTLRRALGETAERPRHIITVPGRGYRFLSAPISDAPAVGTDEVDPRTADSSAAPGGSMPKGANGGGGFNQEPSRTARSWRIARVIIGVISLAIVAAAGLIMRRSGDDTGTDAREIRTLAVLPLRSLASAVGDEHFGLGIADAIIRDLAKFEGVLVRPAGAVRRYAESTADSTSIGRALSVDAVLEGTVQRDGNWLRVSVHLVRVANAASIWTERFDTEWGNIFSVQDQIAEQVADALALQLKSGVAVASRPRRPTADPEAYAAYLKSRYFWNKRTPEGYMKGIEYAGAAVERDPAFAGAHAAMADCYALLGSSPGSLVPRADAP